MYLCYYCSDYILNLESFRKLTLHTINSYHLSESYDFLRPEHPVQMDCYICGGKQQKVVRSEFTKSIVIAEKRKRKLKMLV